MLYACAVRIDVTKNFKNFLIFGVPEGVFSSHFLSKNFRFWSIILQNETKHNVNYLVKR